MGLLSGPPDHTVINTALVTPGHVCCQGTLPDHASLYPLTSPGPSWQSCFPIQLGISVSLQEIALSKVQDVAFIHVEFQDIPAGQFLQCVQVPLDGRPAITLLNGAAIWCNLDGRM